MGKVIIDTCPFNPSHRFKSTKMESHLQRCQVKHSDEGYVRCVLNYNHIVKRDKKLEHLKVCDAADASLFDFLLSISEAKVMYTEKYGKTKSNGTIGVDNLAEHRDNFELEGHTKVQRWLEHNADVVLCSVDPSEFNDAPSGTIVCNDDKSLPSGYDPHECHAMEEYYKNLNKENQIILKGLRNDSTEEKEKNDGTQSTTSATRSRSLHSHFPPPLRNASHFIKAELEKHRILHSDESFDSASCASSVTPNYSKNTSQHIREPCQKEADLYNDNVVDKCYSSTLHNKFKESQNQADYDSVVSFGTTTSNNSLFIPNRKNCRSGNVISNINTLLTEYHRSKMPSVCPEDSVSNVGVSNVPSDIDSYVNRRVVPIDLDSIISSLNLKSIKKRTQVESRTVPCNVDSLECKTLPLDYKSHVTSNVPSMKKETSLHIKAHTLDIAKFVSTRKKETLVGSKANNLDIHSLLSKAVPIDLESLVSSCSFMTANNDMPLLGASAYSEDRPKFRSISVQTEGLCNCNDSVS